MNVLNIKGAIIKNDDKWIYDWLGYDSVCPKDVQNFINELSGEDLIIEINSGGGDIFAASEIYSSIISYRGKVTSRCVGLAGSAASVILSATENEIARTGMVMIHNTQGAARGDYKVLDKTSEILQKANRTILSVYEQKTNLSHGELFELMDKETWLTADEAVEYGFCDRVMESQNTNAIYSIENNRPIVLDSTSIVDTNTINKIRNLIVNSSIENNVPKNLDNIKKSKEHFLYPNQKKEGKKMQNNTEKKINTAEELTAAYPELVKNISDAAYNEAITDERMRLKAIDEIAASLSEDIVSKAKYEEPITAEALALQAIKAEKAAGTKIFNNMVDNILASGANEIGTEANSGISNETEKVAETERKVKNLASIFSKRN